MALRVDQHDGLACENATLTHVRRFGEKATQEQATRIAKMHSGGALFKSSAPKPLVIDSSQLLSAKKGAYGALVSKRQPADQSTNLKKKEVVDKEVPVDLNDLEKKFWVSTCLNLK
jgi:hypothetical protein